MVSFSGMVCVGVDTTTLGIVYQDCTLAKKHLWQIDFLDSTKFFFRVRHKRLNLCLTATMTSLNVSVCAHHESADVWYHKPVIKNGKHCYTI